MKKITLFAFAFVACCAALFAQNPGCDGTRYIDDVFTAGVKKTIVTYAPTVSHTGLNITLAMDVYEPEGDALEARPVVVLAHGGSFVFGDKSMMQQWCERLAKKGYVAASIQYRLFPFLVFGFPDSTQIFDTAVKAVGDMKAAVRYFREDAATANLFRADADNIFVGGYSAGAVTALHAGYLDEADPLPQFLQAALTANGGLEGISGTESNRTYPSDFKAIVNMSGGLYRSNWIGDNDLPLVSIHGTADATVPYTYGLAANIAYLEGSSPLHVRADQTNTWNSLLTAPGAGHTNLYEQTQWLPYIDSFWVNTSTLLESLACTAVGTEEHAGPSAQWSLFPNPAQTDGFFVELPAGLSHADVTVFDAFGKLVFQQKSAVNQQFVRVNGISSGIFSVRIADAGVPARQFEPKRWVRL
jgi:dienelactone hydrolase